MFEAQDGSDPDKSPWPVSSALTARLRRLVTIYQRCNRKELCRPEVLGLGNQSSWVLRDGAHQQGSPKEVKASGQEGMLSCPLGKGDQGNTDS